MPKKVLIMTQNFYPVIGSAGNRMKNIFQLLNEHDIETDVLTTEPAYPNKNLYRDKEFWDDKQLNNNKDNIFRVAIKNNNLSNHKFNRLFFYLEIMFRFLVMLWKLRKNKYDYILVSTPPIFIVFSAFIGKLIFRNKLILEVRDLWPDSLTGVKAFDSSVIIGVFRWLEKRMYRKADSIIINSTGFREHIQNKLGKNDRPIIYLPNGPRQYELKDWTQKDMDDFKVVYTGNLGLAQDIDRLKLAAKLLNDKNITFDVIGYGVRAKEFEEYIKQNNFTQVHLHQPTTRKKSLELIRGCHVAIAFLNNEEVFSTVLPGKIVDYISCKTPVVAGVKGTAAKLIMDNRVGYAVESEDVHEIVTIISDLRMNSNKLEELVYHCESLIEKEFLWEKNIYRLIDIIKK
ncbi:glycosyltransferase family 4 protein [Paucisalibacillus globulus]|uniref:glycosyltransferase family 4 protein n=1 Tax=Paucisalibacillus globulus TaxID=351095 RepID=UPI000BB87E9F|nr:glycosyltransferase family 4 protein [Paucisalibacillus globulus]